uniref:Uncharacterized protein n=1 Tax=Parascaris univalens TaxID=6257 RepID=A0A915AZA2_PARUN
MRPFSLELETVYVLDDIVEVTGADNELVSEYDIQKKVSTSAVTVDREEMQVRLTESRKEEDADGSPEELNWMGCRWNSRQYRKHRKFRSKKL